MKKFTLILFLTVLLSNLSMASNGYNKTANYYLSEKGKIVFRFKTNSKEQFNEINKLVSVVQKKGNTNAIDCGVPVPDVPSLPNATGQCSVTLTPPTATSDCYGPIEGTTSTLTFSTQGTYFVTWLYDDGHGNTSTQIQTVIVSDTTAPIPNLSSLPTITEQCSATVIAPTATDNCSGIVTATTSSPLLILNKELMKSLGRIMMAKVILLRKRKQLLSMTQLSRFQILQVCQLYQDNVL